MARVFVSYSRTPPDESVAMALYRRLSDLGHDVFLDSERVHPGELWPREIRRALDRAEWFIAIVSLMYFQSKNCIDEELVIAARRLDRGELVGLLQVRLAFDGEFPESVRTVLTQTQALRWRSSADTDKMIESIASRLPRPTTLVKGMRAFDAADAAGFAELCPAATLDACCELLRRPGVTVLHGVSGAGKTSFLRAGILPLFPAESWKLIAPSATIPPVVATASLATRTCDSATMLVIDQFEQTVAARGRDAAAAFEFERSAVAWLDGGSDHRLVLVIRDDYRTPFEMVFPALAGRAQNFALLPLQTAAAASALTAILTSAGVEHDRKVTDQLVLNLVDGVPPRVRPALLQLIAHEAAESGERLDWQAWGGTHASRRTFFERHIRATVLDMIGASIPRLAAARVLRGLTAGELKASPRSVDEIATDEKLVPEVVRRVLDLASAPHSRITVIETHGAVERFELVHDLFAGAIHGLVTDEETRQRENEAHRRIRFNRRIAKAAILSAVILATLAVYARHQKVRADQENVIARARLADSYVEQASQALFVDHRPLLALSHLTAARDLGGDDTVLRALFAEATRNLPLATFRHGGIVTYAKFSPDGSRVVTASADSTARVWDAASGHALTPLLIHGAIVRFGTFSPDGGRVVTASQDGTARVWDAATGLPLTPPLVHDGLVVSAEFSPDGQRLVTACQDGAARVWDARSGAALISLSAGVDPSAARDPNFARVILGSCGRSSRVDIEASARASVAIPLQREFMASASFSPDGGRVVTASCDGTARVWDAVSGQLLIPPLVHGDAVVSAMFSPDGGRIVTASWDETAQVWDAATGRPLTPPLEHDDAVESAAFSPDGARVVTASDDKTVRVWAVATGLPLYAPLLHPAAVRSAAFSPDGARIVTASGDAARVWDAVTGRALTPELAHSRSVDFAQFSPDGSLVMTASADGTARIWNAVGDGATTPALKHEANVVAAVFSPDGRRIVTASADGTARVWDASTGRAISPSLVHAGAVSSARFSPDAARVVTACSDGAARIWDANTGETLTPPLQHDGAVIGASFSPDGGRVVTSSADTTARIWDAATGRTLTPPLSHSQEVLSAEFSPDGARVVTASNDATARLWDAATGREVFPSIVHRAAVTAAVFSRDGGRVVTSSIDGTARVWNATTGRALSPPFSDSDRLWSAQFSPDGSKVVTVGAGGAARVWSAATGRVLTTPLRTAASVMSAAFSPDGKRVVTAGLDGVARVWSVATGRGLTAPHALSHSGPLRSVAFSPDGERVVSSSADKSALVWDVSVDVHSLADWHMLADSFGALTPERGPRHPASGAAAGSLAQRIARDRRTATDELSRASNLLASAYSQLPRFPSAASKFAIESADIYRRLDRDELMKAQTCLAIASVLVHDLASARRALGAAAPSSDADLLRSLATAAQGTTKRPALAEAIRAVSIDAP